MSEPDSLYIRARMSPKAYADFLASPAATTAAFDDWMVWLKDAQMSGGGLTQADLDDIARQAGTLTVGEIVEAWCSDDWSAACSHYDEQSQLWQFGILQFSENYREFLSYLPVFRNVCQFKDLPGEDFLLVFPFIWGGAETVCFEIAQGASKLAVAVSDEGMDEASVFLEERMSALQED